MRHIVGCHSNHYGDARKRHAYHRGEALGTDILQKTLRRETQCRAFGCTSEKHSAGNRAYSRAYHHRGIVAHHQPEKHAGNRRYQHLRQSLRGFGERRLLHGVDGNHNHNHHAPIRKRDGGHLHQSAPLQQPQSAIGGKHRRHIRPDT